LGSTAIGEELMAQLVRIDAMLRVNAPATCELEFSDPNGEAASAFTRGTALSVHVGLAQRRIFGGSIAAVELEARGDRVRTIRVLAFDALESLRHGAPVRTHSNVTFAELARELTQPYGIDSTVDVAGPLFPRLVQHRRSDFDLLVSAAERAGVHVWLDGTTLRSCNAAPGSTGITLTIGEDLREANILISDSPAVSSVDVCGWDPHVAGERHGHASGASKSAASLAITNVVLRSDREGDAFARSQMERRVASTAVLQAVSEGNPELEPGTCVRIAGVSSAFAGPFRLTCVTHKLSPELGYVVELSSALPPPHPPRDRSIATLGIVADVRDPEHLGRVKVRYPAVDDAESDWLQVLAAGAGGKKGLVALPAEKDRVLVIGVDDDPAHGVIIGALYGQEGMPGDPGRPLSGYALFSPGGHIIELDDDGALTLRTAGGTSLELGKEKSTLHSTTDLRIEAPGQTITIGASQVEIERA
jgi:phage baseplate assembly protein gpV/phage protein D